MKVKMFCEDSEGAHQEAQRWYENLEREKCPFCKQDCSKLELDIYQDLFDIRRCLNCAPETTLKEILMYLEVKTELLKIYEQNKTNG